MQFDLGGRVAVVTGGNVGIGRAISLALAEAGADVAITHLRHDDPSTVEEIRRLGRKGVALRLDATVSSDVDAAMALIARELGRIDILVNNAGGLLGRVRLADETDEHWDRVMALNVSSAMFCTRAAVRHMDRASGRVINVSSIAARNGGGPGAMAYATSKAAVIGLTRALAKELAPGITVNAVAPGFIPDTPFHEATAVEMRNAMIEATLVKRAGTSEDVAGTVLLLASDQGRFITGAIFDMNGGAFFA